MEKNPFTIFNLSDAEERIYKLILSASKIPKEDALANYRKIKVMDLVKISKYSKPKVYDLIDSLSDKGLIRIDNTRPMFIRPILPELAFKQLYEDNNERMQDSISTILNEINNLDPLTLKKPLSRVPPFSFFIGDREYINYLDEMLQSAKEEIIMIVGFLVEIEEALLKYYIAKKLEEGLKIRILYGGSSKRLGVFMHSFNLKFIEPNQSIIDKHKNNIFLDAAYFAPALRITIVDDKELLMAVKRYDAEDIRMHIVNVSGIQSDHADLVRTTRDAFVLLRTIADIGVLKDKIDKKKSK